MRCPPRFRHARRSQRRRSSRRRKRPPPPSPSTSTPRRTRTSAASSRRDMLPPPDAVRIEEMINYFDYDYPQPTGDVPFSVTTEVARLPVGTAATGCCASAFRARSSSRGAWRRINLVFLLDVSGSMDAAATAAAGPAARSACSSTSCAPRTAWPSSSMPARPDWCCLRRPAPDKDAILAALGRSRSRRLDRGRRRASSWPTRSRRRTSIRRRTTASSWPPTATSTSASPVVERPAEADRGQARDRRLPDRPRLRRRQLQATRCWSCWPTKATATTPTSTRSRKRAKVLRERADRHAGHDRQGRQDAGRVQPGAGRLLPPDRLREPRAGATRTSTTTRRTPARSAPATP